MSDSLRGFGVYTMDLKYSQIQETLEVCFSNTMTVTETLKGDR